MAWTVESGRPRPTWADRAYLNALAKEDRYARGVVAVEFTKDTLEQFVEWLNESHIVRDGYLHRFDVHYWDETGATINETIRTFNGE